MLSKFFLDRPVFAWVIAIIIMAAGALAIYNLPISQYPPIAPPTIAIDASYPGASAETVEHSVTQIIEQKMTGFDNLLYMSATSDSAGSSRIELTFQAGTDPDVAWSQVQNKLQLAMTSLPDAVRNGGITVSKSTRNYLLIVGLISENGSMDRHDLQDFAKSNLEKILARVPGVGEVNIFGSGYAMRIWLNPDKLTSYNLTIDDVITALKSYNVEVSAGQLGGAPAMEGQRLNASIVVQNFLKTPEEFAAIPIRINPDGSTIRIRDIGRTELGTEVYDIQAEVNGKPATGLAIRQAAGANALDTAENVKNKLAELSKFFPHGLKVVYPYDTTPFVKVAISEVVKTLFEAILLVFLVMWLFLGNIRATLIPTIAVPVVLLGTFAILGIFGYSINMLTMFAMVLAIGLLVDDAIVVVENVERIMSEEGIPPKEATAKSMEQITSALIGIGLVLSAVFGPMAFFPGSTGIIYRQFSITIISAMLLSVVVALILTPVLCASLLKPVKAGHEPAESAHPLLRPFFLWFDRAFFGLRKQYVNMVRHSLTKQKRYLIVFLVIVTAMVFLYLRLPTAYLPDEDQGILLAQVLMPKGSTLEQTKAVTKKIENYFQENEKEAVESTLTLTGMGFSGRAQNNGMVFIKLKDWKLRNRTNLRVKSIAGRAMMALSNIREAMVFAFPPPAVAELGMAKGIDFELLDRGGIGHQALLQAQYQLLEMASKDSRITSVRPNGMEDVSQYKIDVDWEKAGALGIPISSIHRTISAAFGSAYVNDFVRSGSVKRVFVQADAPYRMLPTDIEKLYVRNTSGKMVPFSSFASGRWTSGSPRLERFNGFPSLNIWGEAASGRSSGEAMKAMEEIVSKLPEGIGYDWTGLSYQERIASSQAPLLYAFSIFVIFLCLAALYESWTIPMSVLLVFPLGVIGGIIASSMRGLANDVYFQIGLLTTLGLTTKNAILIVQFAKTGVKKGMELIDATLLGVKLRFRPIVMTSLAFGFGVLPLTITTGAGAGAQNAIGTSVLGGMVTATVLVVIFTPLFYVLIEKTFGKRKMNGMNKNTPIFLLLIFSTLISSCTLAPKYTKPTSPIPTKWPTGNVYQETTTGTSAQTALDLAWREFILDKNLQKIIELTLKNNRDLKIAALNVERAGAYYGISRAELLPSVNAAGNIYKERVPGDLSSTGSSITNEKYSVNLGISSWEIDLFGRIRSLKDHALEQYLATQEAHRGTQISLIAVVAQAYLMLAANRENLAIASSTLETQEAIYKLIRKRYEAGIISELDVKRVQSQVDTARGDVARYKQLAAQDENLLNFLAGVLIPQELLPKDLISVTLPKDISPGLSSDVLLLRPDILSAEHQLKAANANIGAARAAFLPRIALTTFIGTASTELSGLFKAGQGTWTFAPQIVMPIFDARTWSAYDVTKVDREISIAQYEKAIQTAFREVVDALAEKSMIEQRISAQQSLVEALKETCRLANARYDKGIDSYLSVLDAQRSLYSAKQVLTVLRLAKINNQIVLFKTLGGDKGNPY